MVVFYTKKQTRGEISTMIVMVENISSKREEKIEVAILKHHVAFMKTVKMKTKMDKKSLNRQLQLQEIFSMKLPAADLSRKAVDLELQFWPQKNCQIITFSWILQPQNYSLTKFCSSQHDKTKCFVLLFQKCQEETAFALFNSWNRTQQTLFILSSWNWTCTSYITSVQKRSRKKCYLSCCGHCQFLSRCSKIERRVHSLFQTLWERKTWKIIFNRSRKTLLWIPLIHDLECAERLEKRLE